MENAPWRLIIIAAAASLILLFLVYFIALPKKTSFDEEKIEKILEFRSAYFSGHERGKKVWEFYAKKGWSGKNKDLTILEDVTDGKFYKNGDLIVKGLKAPQVKAWRRNKVVEAFGVPEGSSKSDLRATVAFTPKGKRRYANLVADRITYNPDAKRSDLSGRIQLKEKRSALFADRMAIDHEKEIAQLDGNIKISRSDLLLTCEAVEYFAKDEKMICRENIKSKIKSQPDSTLVNCNHMIVFADQAKDISASGSLEVFQGKKVALGDNMIYNKREKKIIVTGSVKAVIEKARALLKAQTAQKLRGKEAKKILGEKTVLTSERFEFSTKSGNARASGKVTVAQKDKQAKSDEAVYSDKAETIALVGNVYLKKLGQWIKCQKILISVKNETFDALGSVEAEFKLTF